MPLWLWVQHKYDSEFTTKIKQAYQNMQIAEYYRLLYVAMTRARDELYIYGFTPNKNADELSWHSQLWRVLATDNDSAENIRITND